MIIQGKEYPVIGQVEIAQGRYIPIIDTPMQSDEDWQKGAIKNAVDNYTKEFGKEPENEDEAVRWQRRLCDEMAKKYKGQKIRIDEDGRIIG